MIPYLFKLGYFHMITFAQYLGWLAFCLVIALSFSDKEYLPTRMRVPVCSCFGFKGLSEAAD